MTSFQLIVGALLLIVAWCLGFLMACYRLDKRGRKHAAHAYLFGTIIVRRMVDARLASQENWHLVEPHIKRHVLTLLEMEWIDDK